MSWQATNAVLTHSRSRGTARMVLFVIASHANEAGRGARLSIPTIMQEANAKERAVQYALAELEESGELVILHKGSGRGYASVYDISKLVLESDKGAENAPITRTEAAHLSPLKGANNAPLSDSERVQSPTTKGADFAEKGAKNNVKGAENAPQPIEPKEEPEEIDISVRVEKVFLDYCETIKPVSRTERRLRLIKVRLLEGRSKADLHAVWLGCLRDPWPDRKLHNDITNLLDSPERIERMIELSTMDLPQRSGNGKVATHSRFTGKQSPTRDLSIFPSADAGDGGGPESDHRPGAGRDGVESPLRTGTEHRNHRLV